jgi:large subunit ribosomal protein L15
MPLIRRIPKKKGFTNPNRMPFAVINVARLAEVFGGGEVDPAAMVDRGLVRKGQKVKVLATGDISVALVVKAQAFSEAAKAKIESAGGRAVVVTD